MNESNIHDDDDDAHTPPRQHRPHPSSPFSPSNERNQWSRRQRERGEHLPPPLFFPTRKNINERKRGKKTILICAMFALLEATIKDSGFFGKSPMPGDACIASNLRIMSDLQPDCLDAFPKLKALLAKFDGHAGVQKHIANYPYPYLKRQSSSTFARQ